MDTKIDMSDFDSNVFDNSMWIELPDIDWSCITSGQQAKFFKKGTELYHQLENPNYVYLVKKGRIKLDIYGINGELRTLFVAQTGTLFGELSLIDGLPNICNTTAVSDTILYLIPKHKFLNELNTNHDFSLNLLRVMSKKIRLLALEVKQLSFNNSTHRVCFALINLASTHGEKSNDNSIKISIKFTHQEMANITGLSRVSVSNIFLFLANEGILDKIDGYTIIKNIDIIKQFIS